MLFDDVFVFLLQSPFRFSLIFAHQKDQREIAVLFALCWSFMRFFFCLRTQNKYFISFRIRTIKWLAIIYISIRVKIAKKEHFSSSSRCKRCFFLFCWTACIVHTTYVMKNENAAKWKRLAFAIVPNRNPLQMPLHKLENWVSVYFLLLVCVLDVSQVAKHIAQQKYVFSGRDKYQSRINYSL